MVCDYVKDQSLMVDVLWEVAYGVFKEALHLNSLEDFNATKADLMTCSPPGSPGTNIGPCPLGPCSPLHLLGPARRSPH